MVHGRDAVFVGCTGVASASVVCSFQISESDGHDKRRLGARRACSGLRSGGPSRKAIVVTSGRRIRISHAANLGRSDGYCHPARCTRSADSPTETRSAQHCSEAP